MAKIPGNIDEFDVDAIIRRAAERGEAITPLQVNLQRRIAPDPTREDPIDAIIDRAVKFRDLNAQKRGPTPQELRDRIQAGKLGARIQAKKQIDAKVRELGYSRFQEQQFTKLEDQRAKLFEKLADETWTPEQVQEMEAEIDRKQDLILPGMVTRKATPQETFQAGWVKLPDGSMAHWNQEKQNFTPLNPGTVFTQKEWTESFKEMKDEMSFDVEGKEIKVDPRDVNEKVLERHRLFQEFQAALRGVEVGGEQGQPQRAEAQRPRTLAGRDAFAKQEKAASAAAGRDQLRVFEINSGVQRAGGTAEQAEVLNSLRMPLEVFDKAIAEEGSVEKVVAKAKELAAKKNVLLKATVGVSPSGQDLLSGDREKFARDFHEKREKERRRRRRRKRIARGFTQRPEKIFAPQTFEQFVEELGGDENLQREVFKGVSEGRIASLTDADWRTMYEEYKRLNAGQEILILGTENSGFKLLIKRNPERIDEFLKGE